MSKRKSSYEKWRDRFFAPLREQPLHMSQSECRSLKKLLSQRPENVSEQDWNKLFDQVYEVANTLKISIDPEHEEKGRTWIKEQIRKIKASLKHEPEGIALFEGCNEHGIEAFHFGGYMDATNNRYISSRWRTAVPIWHVTRKDDVEFSYAYGAWQGFDKIILDPPDYL